MVHTTRRGTGVIGTPEKPLEAVSFEASVEHSATALLSFIGKVRTLSGASLAELQGKDLILQIDGGPSLGVIIVHVEGDDAIINLSAR
jgi:hypothetical protein